MTNGTRGERGKLGTDADITREEMGLFYHLGRPMRSGLAKGFICGDKEHRVGQSEVVSVALCGANNSACSCEGHPPNSKFL